MSPPCLYTLTYNDIAKYVHVHVHVHVLELVNFVWRSNIIETTLLLVLTIYNMPITDYWLIREIRYYLLPYYSRLLSMNTLGILGSGNQPQGQASSLPSN